MEFAFRDFEPETLRSQGFLPEEEIQNPPLCKVAQKLSASKQRQLVAQSNLIDYIRKCLDKTRTFEGYIFSRKRSAMEGTWNVLDVHAKRFAELLAPEIPGMDNVLVGSVLNSSKQTSALSS